MRTKSNTKEIEDLIKRIEDFKDQKDEILTELTREIALRLWTKVREGTPVGDYTKEIEVVAKRNSKKHKKGDVYKKKVNPSGKHGGTLRRGWTVGEVTGSFGVYRVEIINNVEYAPYVEFGHRTRNHKGFVKGVYMLTISEQEINDRLEVIIRLKLNKILKEVFK